MCATEANWIQIQEFQMNECQPARVQSGWWTINKSGKCIEIEDEWAAKTCKRRKCLYSATQWNEKATRYVFAVACVRLCDVCSYYSNEWIGKVYIASCIL